MLRMKNNGLGLGLLAGLALLVGCREAPEQAKSPATPGDIRLNSTTVPGGAYTLGAPDGWDKTWTESAGWRAPSELKLAAPAEPWPGYVSITVLHFAGAERTPERYLFDQQGSLFGKGDGVGAGIKDASVAGRPARVFEMAIDRYPPLGMTGDKVPSRVRHVVVPASRSFFVLRYDAPESSAKKYQAIFDRVVESFAPADKDVPPAQDPIPAREYEVYAALFGVKAPGGLNAPQFFSSVPDCRLVAGPTMAIDKPLEPGWPGEDFGALEPAQVEDYKAKNQKEWPLTDRIMVPGLTVISPEELAARLKDSSVEEGNTFGLRGGIVSLSRVGFNSTGDLAVLRAAITTPGAMRARYLVLMKKREATWGLDEVAMEGLIYH